MKFIKTLIAVALCAAPVFGQGRYIKSVNTVSDMALLNPYDYNTNIWVSGISAAYDGGQGIYTYNVSSSAATNGAPYYDVVEPLYFGGRWIRQIWYVPPGGSGTAPTNTITGNLTSGYAVVSSGTTNVASSVTTTAELGYVSGSTGPIQTQINNIRQAPTNTITGNLTDNTVPMGANSTNLLNSPLSVSGGTNVLATGNILANGATLTNALGTASGGLGNNLSAGNVSGIMFQNSATSITNSPSLVYTNGNVGIGTTGPKTKLSLSIAGSHNSVGESTGALSFMTDDGSYTGTITNGVTGKIDSISESSTGSTYGLGFFTGTVGSAGFGERVRIDHDGNVGIGTTVFGTSAAKVLALVQGTDPTSRPADIVQFDASDVVAGDTAFKIFPEATASRYAFGQRARFQGDLIFTNVANGLPYGGIGGGGLSATQTISGSSTPTLVNIAGLAVGLTNEISSGTNYLSPTWPGVYRVEWSMSVEGTTGHDIQGGIMVDGVAITTRGTASIQAIGSAHQSMSSSANVSCPATTNQVSLFLNNRTSAANVNIYDLSVTMTMVGGQ